MLCWFWLDGGHFETTEQYEAGCFVIPFRDQHAAVRPQRRRADHASQSWEWPLTDHPGNLLDNRPRRIDPTLVPLAIKPDPVGSAAQFATEHRMRHWDNSGHERLFAIGRLQLNPADANERSAALEERRASLLQCL